MSDLELERLAAAGDADAFGELYERHSGRLYDFLLRVLRDPDEAADVMQDTFVRALNALEPGRAGAAQFSTWLYKIAHNLAVTRLERRARVIPLVPPGDDDSPPRAELSAVTAMTPEAAAEARELQALVWEAAQALDPKQYALLDLHVRQGLDSGEVADVLGVSKGNAYTMLSRLRQTFESAVAGLVMSRRARGKCAEFDMILEQHGDAPINAALRKRIEEHTSTCETCGEQRRRLVSASALLRAMPLLPLPLLVKQRVGEAAAEAICANAAAMVPGAGTSPAGSSEQSWWQRTRDGGSGMKAAAVAGVAILAAVVMPGAAGFEQSVAPAPNARVAAAAPDVAPPDAPAPSVEPDVVVNAPAPPAASAVLGRSVAPAGSSGGPSTAPDPADPPGGTAAPPVTSPAAPDPSEQAPIAPPRENDPPAPPSPSTPRPPSTATPVPAGTPKHCEHARGGGHDECDDSAAEGDDEHQGRRRGHDH